MAPDLETIARRAMLEKGLIVDFPAAALQQAKNCRDLGSVMEKSGLWTDLLRFALDFHRQ